MSGQIHCLTFGGGRRRFRAAAYRLSRQARASGFFDSVKAVTDLDLRKDATFQARHGAFVAANRRGFGYWLWKPYLILQMLENTADGDLVFYCDSGCEINPQAKTRFLMFVDLLRARELLLFRLSHRNEHWTKRDLLDKYPSLKGEGQLMGGVLGLRAGRTARQVVRAWYELCCSENYRFLDDTASQAQNYPGFVDHRHDQACLSAIVSKYMSSAAILANELIDEPAGFKTPIMIARNKSGRRRLFTWRIFDRSFFLYIKGGKKVRFAVLKQPLM
jgi:hypothetical protein